MQEAQKHWGIRKTASAATKKRTVLGSHPADSQNREILRKTGNISLFYVRSSGVVVTVFVVFMICRNKVAVARALFSLTRPTQARWLTENETSFPAASLPHRTVQEPT